MRGRDLSADQDQTGRQDDVHNQSGIGRKAINPFYSSFFNPVY
jgi:hypothetical protein